MFHASPPIHLSQFWYLKTLPESICVLHFCNPKYLIDLTVCYTMLLKQYPHLRTASHIILKDCLKQ